MEPSLYVGRKVHKHILKSLLATALDKVGTKPPDSITPRLFLFYGENGTGKSSLINLCRASAVEAGAALGTPTVAIPCDLDALRFATGSAPRSVTAMLDALYAAAPKADDKLAAALSPFGKLRQNINDCMRKRQHLIDIEWPREAFLAPKSQTSGRGSKRDDTAGTAGVESRFKAWLESKIDAADLALCSSPEQSLTKCLAECLAVASLKTPLILCIDSLELAGPAVERWLAGSFLPLLVNKENRLACVLAGSHGFVRGFRNDFPERLLYTLTPAELPLSQGDITEFAVGRGITLAPDQIDQIERITAGVPLAVQAMLDFVKLNVPMIDLAPDKQAETPDTGHLVKEITDRFIHYCDESTMGRVFSLALLYRFDQAILAQLWGMPPGEIKAALSEIAIKYSFLTGGDGLQEAVRDLLRNYLIEEAARGESSPLASFLKTFATVHAEHYARFLERKQTEIPSAADRFTDADFQGTVLGLFYSLLLSSHEEAARRLPGIFVEALHYNRDFAERLLDVNRELRPLLTPDLVALINQLKTGLAACADADAPLLPGRRPDRAAERNEGKNLVFMEKYFPAMSPIQQGLLFRLKGRLAAHGGNFLRAMEEFDRAASLFGASAGEQALLFSDFMAVGYSFIKSGERRKAIDAFGKAASIKLDDYSAWNELARSQQSVGEHASAIESYNEAVKIRPDAADAWFEYGKEFALVNDHARAVEAFIRVTEIDGDRPSGWFNLAISLEALSRFPEAQNAAAKVVAMVPDHWEAHFALGRALAARNYSREAIDAFGKAVAIKPDCRGAWEALGRQLLAVESFESAADALEKAAELDAGDHELWQAIGTAWYGAGNFDKSIRSCQKAVKLRKDYFDAWVTLGCSFTGLENFKDAYFAFATAAEINPKDREVWVNVGNSLYSLGEFQTSIEAFVKATELRSDVDGIWYSIGMAYQAQRKFAESVDTFQKSIDLNPGNAEAWYQQGRSYAELGWQEDASSCFAKTVELAPDAPDGWFRWGLSLAKQEKHAEAIDSFIKATGLRSTDAEIWYQLGLSYATTGNAEEAVKAFTSSIGCDENRPDVYHQLGLAQESLGLYEEAIPAFRKATEAAMERVDSWLHLGLCCNLLSRYAEAAEALRKVRELEPDTREALLPLALASHALGEYAEAVGLYRMVIAFQPDSEEALYNLALALHAMNSYDEAFEAYRTVVEKWPSMDQAWYNMGLAYHAIGDYQQAIAAYREASRLNRESPDIWYQLGMVYYATEQYGEAILSFRKVIARNDRMYEAWYNLGNAYLIWGEYGDAIASYKKAVEIKPDDFSVWGCLANAFYAAGTYDKAVEAGSRAMGIKSDEPWILCTLGLAKLFSGDVAGADPCFESLLAFDSEGQEVERAVTELRKALALKPSIPGGNEALLKLTGGLPAQA